ncbi:hypothetical protein H5410_016943 [Solanum commersonii]|uniref:WRKY domain-containing protein n=1 Tax=Solanum commersonii TaxID=4109 RepID=A0A9J5ZZ44_SOLCO|nr:hypothetical protein H5410_016943 [Solanum commersonii]
MEDNNWDLSAVVRSHNINKPNDVIVPNSGLKKSNDQVIITDQNSNQEMYLHPIQPNQFSQQIILPPLPTMIMCVSTTSTTPQESIYLQQLEKSDDQELTDDKRAWRNYGQKSIKGSPFPRNYFKCSTLGSCKATKIIENSPKNENYFLVSYSDEHNHDPLTYCRSLALYNNSSKRKLSKSINIVPKALNLKASSSSSKRAKSFKVDASSISPFAPTLEIERNNEMVDVVVENKDDIEEEENTYDNIFMDFEELHELLLPSNGNEIDKRN